MKKAGGERDLSNDPAVVSTAAVTSTMYNNLHQIKREGSLESVANVQLALISQ